MNTGNLEEVGRLKLRIRSEYESLAAVMVHTPGKEIDRLDPLNRSKLLFEDIPYLPRMQREHDDFCLILANRGVEVFYLRNLVNDVVSDDRIRRRLLLEVCALEHQYSLANILYDHFDHLAIAEIFFSGITANEVEEETGLKFSLLDPKKDEFLLPPIPNAYFTRDPAVVIDDSIVSCKTHFTARARETILTRCVFNVHRNFDVSKDKFLFGYKKSDERPFTIEGGDIIVINENAIAVGCSERTRSESIRVLAERIFSSGGAQRVYEVPIPAERTYMHLDTVFTIIDRGKVVAYPDVMNNIKEVRRYEPIVLPGAGVRAVGRVDERPFFRILEDEFETSLKVFETGGRQPHKYAAREQGADGTNMFAIAPSVVVSYNRNIHTNSELRDYGIEVLEIEGSELVRGLGGPRCMTMPLSRLNKER